MRLRLSNEGEHGVSGGPQGDLYVAITVKPHQIFRRQAVNVVITNLSFDAVNAGYQVVLPTDAIAGTPREYAEQVFQHTLRNVATLATTDDVNAAWS